jgi:hypothetical protein
MYGFYLSYFFTSYSEIVLYLRTTAKVNLHHRVLWHVITVFCGTSSPCSVAHHHRVLWHIITVFCGTSSPCSVAHHHRVLWHVITVFCGTSSPCSVAHHHRVLWHTEHTITVFCGTQNTLRVIFSKNDILRCTPTLHIFLLHIQKWFYLYKPPLKGKFLC